MQLPLGSVDDLIFITAAFLLKFTFLYFNFLFCTLLSFTFLYFPLLSFTLLYFHLLSFTFLSFTFLYFTFLYFNFLFCTFLYFTFLYFPLLSFTLLYSIIQQRLRERMTPLASRVSNSEGRRDVRPRKKLFFLRIMLVVFYLFSTKKNCYCTLAENIFLSLTPRSSWKLFFQVLHHLIPLVQILPLIHLLPLNMAFYKHGSDLSQTC